MTKRETKHVTKMRTKSKTMITLVKNIDILRKYQPQWPTSSENVIQTKQCIKTTIDYGSHQLRNKLFKTALKCYCTYLSRTSSQIYTTHSELCFITGISGWFRKNISFPESSETSVNFYRPW